MSGPARPGDGEDSRLRRAVGWLVRDRTTGQVVIGQRPNTTILVVVVATVLRWVVVDTGLWAAPDTALRVVAALGLAWWGLDELLRGVNPLRRGLGLVALAYLALVRVPALLG